MKQLPRIMFIVNPTARGGKAGGTVDRLRREFQDYNHLDIIVTNYKGDAESAAKSAVLGNYQYAVAVGGDGTINEVVNGLAGSDVTLGVIACGTANVLARELRLPINDISHAAAVIRQGHQREIDLGRLDSRYFAAMAGIGFDAAVLHRLVPKTKRWFGLGAYGMAIAGELANLKPSRFFIEVDGSSIETDAFIVLIANSASYAYGVKVASDAVIDDGWLDLIIFERAEPHALALLHQALRVIVHTHLRDPNICSLKGRSIKVEANPDVFTQVDGELTGKTPVMVEVIPKGMNVVVP